MIKAVFFDFDGILFDTERMWNSLESGYVIKKGYPFLADRMKLMICCDKSIDIFDVILEGYEDIIDKKEFEKDLFEYLNEVNPVTPFEDIIFPDVKPILKWLKDNNYLIACASSSSYDYVSEGLNKADIFKYFDLIVSGRDFERNKPYPDCYEHCMNSFNLKPDECLVVEDSPNGILCGHNAGMKVVVRKDYDIGLDQRGGDYFLDSYDELPAIIDRINNQK